MNTAYDTVAAVVDPELRVITIAELGILRSVQAYGNRVEVIITPTYSGCPAMDVIRADIVSALRRVGYTEVRVGIVLHPAWTTDWISDSGRTKLAAAGIAPPGPATRGRLPSRVPVMLTVRCPRCGSPETDEVSRFGSTSCKALWRCRRCTEPFEHIKAI